MIIFLNYTIIKMNVKLDCFEKKTYYLFYINIILMKNFKRLRVRVQLLTRTLNTRNSYTLDVKNDYVVQPVS